MSEGGSLFNPGYLGTEFKWWIGQVADDATWRDNINPGKFQDKDAVPGWGRRYKVRILGMHDWGGDKAEGIEDGQLPWANVMYPITAGGGQNITTPKKQKVNETIPAAAREWKNLEKAEQVYTKAVLDLGKVVGKQDQKAGREVVGLYRTLSASMKKFKELLSREILDKIQ